MKANVKGLLVISFNLLILLGIGILWMHSVKSKRIERVQSLVLNIETGGQGALLEEKDIRQWIHKFYQKELTRIPVYALKLEQLEKYLKAQPLVRNVEAFMDPHNGLHLMIEQRHPVVRVVDMQGGQFYLDETGYVIPVSAKYASRVPVATGLLTSVGGEKLEGMRKMQYGALLQWVKAIETDSFARALVEQIDLDEHGDFVLIPKIGNEKILVGGAESIPDKLNRLRLFYRENLGRQGWNVYETINLKFKGQIVGKKEKLES